MKRERKDMKAEGEDVQKDRKMNQEEENQKM
jgi:hypothetical protein